MKILEARRIFVFILLNVSILCFFLFAQRGFKVMVETSEGSSIELYRHYRALVIGVSDYLYYPKLPNAVKDAREVASVLKKRGFLTTILENPTSKEINRALSTLIFQKSEEEDGIFIYFSGHGETMKLADGTELGYIIPRDCPVQSKDPISFREKAISMEEIQTFSLQLKAKHLLALFDSCFSGSIFTLERAAPVYITHKTALPVRQYITSGSADESVPDRSVFKDCFLDALKGEGDANKDGYVTGSELGMFLESEVVNYTRNSQHPQYGKIRNRKLNKGDFVFVLEKAKPADEPIQLPPKPPETQDVDITSLKEKEEKIARIQREWESWQKKMRSNFTEIEGIDRSQYLTTKDKKEKWQEFLEYYSANNPYSSEDEQLRQRAAQRVKELEKIKKLMGTRVRLRSSGQSLSLNEVGAMLKRHNFFSKKYDWNKSFCNPRGDFANEYEVKTIRSDRVVLDNATGLMWHQSGSEKYMTYSKAKQWIEELNQRGYAGYHDWRLPTLEEGASLIERSKMNGDLYIDPKFSAKQSWIWTSDTVSGFSSQVWIVYFYFGGYVRRNDVGYDVYVRPVRSG